MNAEHGGAARASDRIGGPLPPHSSILIVDVHELVGWSLAWCLRDAGEPAAFCPARSVDDIPGIVRRGAPGLLVLELRLGCHADGHRVDGPGLIGTVTDRGWRAVVLTGTAGQTEIGAALDAGAFGWMPKTLPFPALLSRLRAARAGRPIMPEDQRRALVERSREQTSEREHDRAALSTLTPRELDVLTHLAAGRRPQAIAARFSVSPHTVRAQIRSVLVKLEVRSQLEAVALFHTVVSGRQGGGTSEGLSAVGGTDR